MILPSTLQRVVLAVSRRRARCRVGRSVAIAGFVGLLLAPAAVWAAQDPGSRSSPQLVGTVDTYFIDAAAYAPTCDELTLEFQEEVAAAISEERRAQLEEWRRQFDGAIPAIQQARLEAARLGLVLQLATADVLRRVGVGAGSSQQRDNEEEDIQAAWDVGRDIYEISEAESVVLIAGLGYMQALSELESAENSQRTIATQYYAAYAAGFPVLGFEDRLGILDQAYDRVICIDRRRRDLFESLRDDGNTFWTIARQRAGAALDETATNEPTASSEATDPGDRNDSGGDVFDQLGDAAIRDVLRQRQYAWLAGETSTSASILSTLIAAHETAAHQQMLHPARVERFLEHPESTDLDPPPFTLAEEDVRLMVLEERAWTGVLALIRQRLAAEAGYRTRSSALRGMGQALSAAERQLGVTAGGLVANPNLQLAEPGIQALAVLAIAHKILGDSFGLLVATPLQDAFTEYAMKPALALFGEEVRTSADTAYDDYRKVIDVIEPQEELLTELWAKADAADALAFVSAVRAGTPGSGGIGARDEASVMRLLEDADFIAATGGGLPWIFEIICDDPADRYALFLAGARYELSANTRVTLTRVATARGLTVNNPDAPVTAQRLDAVLNQESSFPEDWWEAAVLAAQRTMRTAPVIGPLIQVYNAPQTLRNFGNWWYGNLQSQEGYLRDRVEQHEQLGQVMGALEDCAYEYPCLSNRYPEAYRAHLDLVNRSAEYAEAYRRIQNDSFELQKLHIWSWYRDRETGRFTSEGRGLLASAQFNQDMENADLIHRAGALKYVYHVLTVNYGAAVEQLKAFEQLETMRRRVFNDRADETVDFSAQIHEAETWVVREELVAVYEGLYKSAIKDMVVSLGTDLLINQVMSSVTDATNLRYVLEEAPDQAQAATQLASKLNPWAGKFSAQGVYNTFVGSFGDSIKNSWAQVLARRQTTFNEAELEGAIDLVLSVLDDVQQGVRTRVEEGDVEWALDRMIDEERELKVEEFSRDLEALYAPIWQRREELMALGDTAADYERRVELLIEIQAIESNPRIQMLHRSLRTVMDDAVEIIDRRFAAEEEARLAARRIASGLLTARARDRARDAAPGSNEEAAAAQQIEVLEFLDHLGTKNVRLADVERLIDENDPLGLSTRLLKQVDVGVIRNALKTARENEPNNATRINDIARLIDRTRIVAINTILRDFVERSDVTDQRTGELIPVRDLVQIVIQGGAAEGNPEYQGIFGDIDFTIFTRDGSMDAEVKKKMLAVFKERGFPLAEDTPEAGKVDGFMDSEGFVQPWGRFDSGAEDFGDVIYDVASKRRDPTRFYSEAGSKWFINNVAYSGLVLCCEENFAREWVRIEPGEAYGLAVDMTRYLSFLTDPDYTSDAVGGLENATYQQKQLTAVLKNSKYFIRLVDAYLISHAEVGNFLYNEKRLERRAETGDDASYHKQIFKDAEMMVRILADPNQPDVREHLPPSWIPLSDGERTARAAELQATTRINSDDLEFIGWMADLKMKGVNPDPWEVIPGNRPEDKVENALRLLDWMHDKAPEMIADTGQSWQVWYEEAMRSGDSERQQVARADARRIGTVILNRQEKDAYGPQAMMSPPVTRVVSADPVTTVVSEDPDVPADPRAPAAYEYKGYEQHRDEIRERMEISRDRRAALKAPIAAAIAAAKAEYRPDEYLSNGRRRTLEEHIKGAIFAVQSADAVQEEEGEPFEWVYFWFRR